GAVAGRGRVLNVGLKLPLRRHELGSHAGTAKAPGGAAIARGPDSTAGDADDDVARVARIDADGMDAGVVGATAKPLLAQRIIPERAVECPGVAAVFGPEEAAGQSAAPKRVRLVGAAGSERPHQLEGPVGRLAFDRDLGDVV